MTFASLLPLPQRSSWTVGGELQETLFWPCTGSSPRAVMLLIPGNPGLIDFYIDFCNALHTKFPQDLDIVGVSHLGHTRFSDNRGMVHRPRKVYGLDDQVANIVAVFDELHSVYKMDQPKMLLCGHSVGCYLAQKIVECRGERVDRVFSLFPAVDNIAEAPRGRQLRLMFKPGIRQVVVGAVGVLRWLLPASAITKLASLSNSLGESNTRLVVDKMLHGACVNNVLKMAADEMQDIKAMNHELYSTLGGKFVMYYGVDDMWVPENRYWKMFKINTKGKVALCSSGISHAFVTAHSAKMAVIMIKMLANELEAEIIE
ncbi:hypothetical protein BX070DRAFT_196021 [Coemansia spiralis]|nr:hypothetical protein BX070DRAFT_196021 [Coemansia spiralis]